MKHAISALIKKRKYELLLIGLLQHLFVSLFLTDLQFYVSYIWPLNMVILGISSIGLFADKERWKVIIKNTLVLLVLAFPIGLPFFANNTLFYYSLNVVYILFFAYLFTEIIQFLIKPSYINVDVISASACGYLLLIEIATFLMQFFYYTDTNSFKGLNTESMVHTYIDLVYFCSITITSIGFGDITPQSHFTKMATSLFGIAGQFYTVVLVGILISKFSSQSQHNH